MLVAPVDAWYVWIGLTAASVTLLGIVSAVPAAPPPDADGAADTIDRIATSRYAAIGEHPLTNAESIRVGSDTISLRGPGGTTDSQLGYGPVVSATSDPLRRVLLGKPPERAFESGDELTAELDSVRDSPPDWFDTDRLIVRRIRWEGVDVTLVG